ncbi:transcriptional regulator ArsR family [Candidatus Termititenax persephonae]|uniref:Transcriptional regulator ArsR family n=1 Tax=Candidatus Termititenax persephonae TaxID=2218525 RepID=A0A388TH06_9BACT|nr:transcriptional regulator ArsR family [Candidatus Termititenax persephonae]
MENCQSYVRFLRALASEERLAILEDLERNGEINASKVENKFFMEQSTASHHLNVLYKAGIIEPRKTGRNIFYRLREDSLQNFYGDFLQALKKKEQAKAQENTIAINSEIK